jgi:hypothetical protein
MLPTDCVPNRRNFLKFGAVLVAGLPTLTALPETTAAQHNDAWLVGPQPGYSPEIGTLVSMLAFTRDQVLQNVKSMSVADLDFLLDAKANTIGALLNHLAATEAYYQATTFAGFAWDKVPDSVKQKWEIPMNLGEPARKAIKATASPTTQIF